MEEAIRKAREETRLDVPISHAAIAVSPWAFERRLEKVPLRGFKKLTLLVPERHDWALMKITRLIEKDIEDIKEVHAET